MLIQQRVDVGRRHVAGVASHRQHVADDAVGALAVIANATQVVCQVLTNFGDDFALVLRQRVLGFVEHFLQFLQQLLGPFGEVLHELSGFLISCATPAVSSPSAASFSRDTI